MSEPKTQQPKERPRPNQGNVIALSLVAAAVLPASMRARTLDEAIATADNLMTTAEAFLAAKEPQE